MANRRGIPGRGALSIKPSPAESKSCLMLRVASTLLLLVLVVVAAKTAQSLASNGDTGLIIVETGICVVLLSGVVLCKNIWRARTE